ncbi:MAG: SGNH/GDSL hydrolase family protein [Planctomycetota bacterium]
MLRSPRSGRALLRSLLVILVLTLLLAEGVLRMGWIQGYTRAEMRPSFEQFQAKAIAQGHPYLAYSLKPDLDTDHSGSFRRTTTNSAGYRGPLVAKPKPAGTFRVLCLGGSSTHGTTPTDDAHTWPARLQEHLRTDTGNGAIEVLNFGVFGYSTFESLINLELRGVDFEPDLVLVYHTINDMRCALYKPGGPVQPDNTQWRAIWPVLMPSPGESLLEKSLVYCAWRKRFTSYLSRFEKLDAFAIVNYDPMHPDPYAGPVADLGFENFARNLKSIHAVARAHGAQVMYITQGCDRADMGAGSKQLQWDGMDRMGEILKTVAHETSSAFCDARPVLETAFAQVPAEVQQLEKDATPLLGKAKDTEDYRRGVELWQRFTQEGIFTGEVHLTDRGADLLARTVADTIFLAAILERKP